MREKRVMTVTHSRKVVVKEEKFSNTRKPSHQWVCGEFWNLGGQHNQKEKTNKQTKKKTNPQNTCLTEIASGEVAQRLVLATSKQGLGRETQAA